MNEKREFFSVKSVGPTILVHSTTDHSEASGGWIEYDTTTEYHYHEETRQVIRRVYSSCDNIRDHRKNWDHRLDSEKILSGEKIPEEVREKIRILMAKKETWRSPALRRARHERNGSDGNFVRRRR